MKAESLSLVLNTNVENSLFGGSGYRSETAYLYKAKFGLYDLDIKKAVSKALASLKCWEDSLEISVMPENGHLNRVWFATRDYEDRENGTVTLAMCDESGCFTADDRKRVSLGMAKKRLVEYISGIEFC